MLDGFLVEHPPVDLLYAGMHGWKKPSAASDKRASMREAAQANAKILSNTPLPRAQALDSMPEYLRSPEMLKLIADMKAGENAGQPAATG